MMMAVVVGKGMLLFLKDWSWRWSGWPHPEFALGD